eukprot:GHVP01005218.1.p1 GENE.GHVP01005218.1~~GHVP01005218.1.p1  ORF type:complete len:374 (+),score=69.56 GHVP01005218.1:2202-3323(+)
MRPKLNQAAKLGWQLIVLALCVLGLRYLTIPKPDMSQVRQSAVPALPYIHSRIRSGDFKEVTGPCTSSRPCEFKVIADLDVNSRVEDQNILFHSYLASGNIFLEAEECHISFSENSLLEILGKVNEAGRGMELSELLFFDQVMYAFDDRTGVIFRITKSGSAIPRHILMEGDGTSTKGMKIEWATVKDGTMHVGSFGKEYTDALGEIVNHNNLWISLVTSFGDIYPIDWTENYTKMRAALGAEHPGYLIHEAVLWKPTSREWIVLPRRVSKEPYVDSEDELRGSNKILICSEDFNQIRVLEVGSIDGRKGFSSAKFLPGSNETIVVAIKSEENSTTNTQNSYISVFDLNGKVYCEHIPLPHPMKFEGLEFAAS